MAEIIIYYWPNIDLHAAIQLIVVDTRWAILNSVLYMWQVLVFFSKLPAPKRWSCGKGDDNLDERE